MLRLHVLVHIRPVDELLPAVRERAEIWPFPGVDATMSVEPRRVLEFASAELAKIEQQLF